MQPRGKKELAYLVRGTSEPYLASFDRFEPKT